MIYRLSVGTNFYVRANSEKEAVAKGIQAIVDGKAKVTAYEQNENELPNIID